MNVKLVNNGTIVIKSKEQNMTKYIIENIRNVNKRLIKYGIKKTERNDQKNGKNIERVIMENKYSLLRDLMTIIKGDYWNKIKGKA